MISLLRRHLAWRFLPTKGAYRVFRLEAARRARIRSEGLGRCTRCHGPRDDPAKSRCEACRVECATYQRNRALRRQADTEGNACPRCYKPNTNPRFKTCDSCRTYARQLARDKRRAEGKPVRGNRVAD